MKKETNWRINYPNRSLFQDQLGDCPFDAFDNWLNDAKKAKMTEPNAFALATVDETHLPDNRMVLLKAYDKKGFIFYSNYNSKKGEQLSKTPKASMLFWWPDLHRQIRIRGSIDIISKETSDEYFQTRDRQSQISAWASKQSETIKNYHQLIDAYQKATEQFKSTKEVPRPDHWGGYKITPLSIEFWQGRHSRLHERIRFKRDDISSQIWQINHLAP